MSSVVIYISDISTVQTHCKVLLTGCDWRAFSEIKPAVRAQCGEGGHWFPSGLQKMDWGRNG